MDLEKGGSEVGRFKNLRYCKINPVNVFIINSEYHKGAWEEDEEEEAKIVLNTYSDKSSTNVEKPSSSIYELLQLRWKR